MLLSCSGKESVDSVAVDSSGPVLTVPGEPFPIGDRSNFTDPAYSAASFRSTDEIFRTRTVERGIDVSQLVAPEYPYGLVYEFEGQRWDLEQFAKRTDTTGLLILEGTQVLYERYYKGADERSRFLSMSVAKSLVSMLVGMAFDRELIDSLEDPIERYLDELQGSGFEAVTVGHLLEMSSGIGFSEEYDDPDSDIARLAAPLRSDATSFDQLLLAFERAREPGERFEYASLNTQVLAHLLTDVSGESLTTLMSEWLWQPLGAERSALFLVEEGGAAREAAFGGFAATLRDYARAGLLMAQEGRWGEDQLLDAAWVRRSTQPQNPQVAYGALYEGYPLGYSYHWWCFPGDHRAFLAQGIHGQFLLVDPVRQIVMVKTSNWPVAWDDQKEAETYALFDAVRR